MSTGSKVRRGKVASRIVLNCPFGSYGHTIPPILVDAASARVIEEALLKAGLVGRTHSRILPVVSVDEA